MTTTPAESPWQIITCDNPSAMTLEGTNSYLLGEQEAGDVVVVDPGPAGHPEHVEAVLAAAGERRIGQIIVTHRHGDHTGAAAELAAAAGAPVRGFDAEQCLMVETQTAEPLVDGEVIEAGGLRLEVLHTPGHTSDSVCLWLPEHRAMLTGDTILGRGTTMVDFPDSTLTDYLETLQRLAGYQTARVLPAHGSPLPDLTGAAEKYLRHRAERLAQTRALLAEHGELSAEELGQLMYRDRNAVPEQIRHQVAAAQLDHLRNSWQQNVT